MCFALLERSLHTPLLQTSSSSVFLSCSFQIPDHPTAHHWLQPMSQCIIYNHAYGHFSSEQSGQPGGRSAPSSARLGKVSLSHDSAGTRFSDRGCGAAAVHWGGAACVACRRHRLGFPNKETLFGKVGTEELPSHHFILTHERGKNSLARAEKARFFFFKLFFRLLF